MTRAPTPAAATACRGCRRNGGAVKRRHGGPGTEGRWPLSLGTLLLPSLASAQASAQAQAQAQVVSGPAADAPSLLIGLGIAVGVLAAVAVLACGAWWRAQRQRSALQQQLQQERAQSHALAHQLDLWQWHSDAQHRLRLWRAPAGTPPALTSPPAPLLWEHFQCEGQVLRVAAEQHAALHGLPVWHVDPAGARRELLLRGSVVLDGQGRFAGYCGTAREQTTALGPLPTPDETEDHAAFSYTVSHDLRAPIRVVEGFTRILKEDYGRLLDRIGNDHLDRVLGAAARMNSMIDALLALSQLSSQPLTRQPINLSQLAGYIVDDLRRQSPGREVVVHIEPGLLAVGDPTLLRMALENLLGNAWKYTAKARNPHIWLEHCEHEGRMAFAVRDNGAGFDMRFADRLFGAFQRLHSANDFQGTGVGLASVRRIVRRHGGDVWAEGEVDRGARFVFWLEN